MHVLILTVFLFALGTELLSDLRPIDVISVCLSVCLSVRERVPMRNSKIIAQIDLIFFTQPWIVPDLS